MKNKSLIILTLVLLSTLNPQLITFAQGTAFTYQGRLNDGINPANGTYNLRFALFDALTVGNQVGSPLTNSPVNVSNGIFTVVLDFGNQFPGADRWLEIGVRTNGNGLFSTLSPRQKLTLTPYALYASAAGVASNASSVMPGAVGNAGLAPLAITADKIAPGQIVTSLNGLVDAVSLIPGTNISFQPGPNGIVISAVAGAGATPINVWVVGGQNLPPGPQILGTTDNDPLVLEVNGLQALELIPDTSGNAAPNILGGSPFNSIDPGVIGATIAGGGSATDTNASPQFSQQGPGTFPPPAGGDGGNKASANFSTVGGGQKNAAGASYSTVAGGYANNIFTLAQNAGPATYSTIAGGERNSIKDAADATIGGGEKNMIGHDTPAVDGAHWSTIAGGSLNTNAAYSSTIGGGVVNLIQINASQSTIGGGADNTIQIGAAYSTIGGGFYNTNGADLGTIAGGWFNSVATNASASAIGGGSFNSIDANTPDATVSGGRVNHIEGNADNSTIGGGLSNSIQTFAVQSTIGGGFSNTVGAYGLKAVIAGGSRNTIGSDAFYCTIGGGSANTIHSHADISTISGGYLNTIQTNASFATVPGGYLNSAQGQYSFAAGSQANAQHDGTFVWAGGNTNIFSSYTSNQFTVFAAGGVEFNFGYPPAINDTNFVAFGIFSGQLISTSAGGRGGLGANLSSGGTWVNVSDRNQKENFAPVDAGQVLNRVAALPIARWNYKSEGAAQTHLGPMAQDFYAAFGFGADDKHIATVDEGGVALAAIQGLNQKLEVRSWESEDRSRKLEAENAELKQRLDALEKIIRNQKSN